MDRRIFLQTSSLALFSSAFGCRGTQKATVLDSADADTIASHQAGAETWKPLIDEAVGRLAGRQIQEIQQTSAMGMPSGKKKICFIGVENESSEEIGDFRVQIEEHIETQLSQSELFSMIHSRYVDAGLREARIRPDDLFMPNYQQIFTATMQKMNQPFDYLLFAKITSGTTRDNHKYQRDYLLTLDLIDIHTGEFTKESAMLRKKYRRSAV